MIVMKFGGTSVESAAAIERVAGIVKGARRAPSRGGGLGHGQDHQQAAGHRRRRHCRQARGIHPPDPRPARFPFARGAPGGAARPSAPSSTVFLDEHFQELTELVKGLACWAKLTPRSIDAISSYGERLSSSSSRWLPHFGMNGRARGFARRHRHRQAPHPGRARFPRDLRAPGATIPPLAARAWW
jgi:aspartate kinase